MAPIKTRAPAADRSNCRGSSRPSKQQRGKPCSGNTPDGDDVYGMRELKHQLAGLHLMLKDTVGDGNCLFRACADQFTGSDQDHGCLRQEVCLYIEENADHFRSFLDNETVDSHVAQMRKNGTYGGNVELVAFARLKKVDIKVYQPGFIYVIEGIHLKKEGLTAEQRPTLHIAYHSWEHYSSIRNIDGPHEGLPRISPRAVDQEPLEKLTDQDSPRAIEEEVMKITGTTDLRKVREVMEKYQGDLNGVYSELAEWEYQHAEETVGIDEKLVVKEQCSPQHEQTPLPSPPLAVPSLQVDDEQSEGLHLSSQKGQTETENIKIEPTAIQANAKGSGSVLKSDKGKEQPPSETTEKIAFPKKRMSLREKRELAKRNQKLNRKNKGKDNASESSTNLVPKSTLSLASSSTTAPGTENKSMRELFV